MVVIAWRRFQNGRIALRVFGRAQECVRTFNSYEILVSRKISKRRRKGIGWLTVANDRKEFPRA